MALQLILDADLNQLAEPGFWQFITSRQMAESGNPSDSTSYQGIFCDEPTRTLMLRPLQLESSWLNTAAQADSILRLYDPIGGGGAFYVNAADISAQSIFEAACFGNADNPYIFHVPVGPSGAFPGHVEEVPGSAPSLVGVPAPVDPSIPELLVQGPTVVYQPSLTVSPPSSPPALTGIGNTADGKFVSQSTGRMAANQPLFFRWYHPPSLLGFPCIYEFYVGQFKLRIKDVTVEIFLDISAAGDRSAWKKVQVAPLFCLGDLAPTAMGSVTSVVRPAADLAHDRYLLWMPFRENQVLLYSSSGKWAIIQVNSSPKRLPDNSDWDIVRSDSLLVWVLTPAAGRFQVQKVKFPSGTIKMQAPIVTLDYTPTSSPTLSITGDTDHGTSLSGAQTQPPAYTIPANVTNDCPPSTTTTTDQRRQYGIELSFQASSDHRWTPFFYGFSIEAVRVYASSPATPTTVTDTTPGLVTGTLNAGLQPGEGRMTAEVIDAGPSYPLSPYYYRCSFPIQLFDSGSSTTYFTGITAPVEVTPLRETGSPRRLTFSAADRWKQLADTYLRDQRDWTGFGHIDVVKFIAEQGGVDCSAAQFPSGWVPDRIDALNSPLGGALPPIAQRTRDLEAGWRPRDDDTAASYIKRIQDLYSAWYCGFRLDGTFFYLPRTYYTTPTVTFTADPSDMTGNPVCHDPVTFTTKEPEANVILVKAGNQVNGQVNYSALWIDWQSIKNPSAVNYLGRWRAEVVSVGGVFSCSQLNWIARTIWQQTRRRFVEASFEADFVPSLGIGQAFTLASYGNYRLVSMEVRLDHQGFHRAHYTGQLIENGY